MSNQTQNGISDERLAELANVYARLSTSQKESGGVYWPEAASMAHELTALRASHKRLVEENARLNNLINTPHIDNFLESVRLEASHQQERWGTKHDAGKEDPDWFWLIGYLAGKAIRPGQTLEKRLHHIITTAAVCLNWHRHIAGDAHAMRPGINAPEATLAEAARLEGK